MDPQGATKDKAWLNDNWKLLSDFAVESFTEKGKGAVVVHDKTPGQIPENIFYLPQAEIPGDDPDTTRMVKEYDPGTQFVVLMIHPDINSSYRLALQ